MSEDSDGVTTAGRIESIHIKGFRSLADVKLDNMPNPMVLLGANGSGKSNVLRFFEMLREMFHGRLAHFVLEQGGADDQLLGGQRQTRQIDAVISFDTRLGANRLSLSFALMPASEDRLAITPASDDRLAIASEEFHFTQHDGKGKLNYGPYPGGIESSFYTISRSPKSWREEVTTDFLSDCSHYQFRDTSRDSPIQKPWDVEDNHRLLAHGGNLAPILLRLREVDFPRYRLICRHIERVMPDFDDFEIQADCGETLLRWRSQNTNKTIGAHLTSDGTLRCFCLVTLLNLPNNMLPKIILLDEPELGLHPFAISLVSHMVKSLAQRRQIIVATQSSHFVDAFDLDEIVVLNIHNGRTEAKRLSEEEFGHWLEEYTTGELWRKNVLGGYP